MNHRQSTQNRFALLAKMNENIFHSRDLANIWQINNKNTLHTTLKRYFQKGLIHRIHRGLYSLEPIDRLDPLILGVKALHDYTYISTETVLAQVGIIQQKVYCITLVSSASKKFSIGVYNYISRQLNDKYLYNDIGKYKKAGINYATAERAVADMLYFNPRYNFDAPRFINWKKVKLIQKQLLYDIT